MALVTSVVQGRKFPLQCFFEFTDQDIFSTEGQVCNSKSSSNNNFRIQSQSDADALSNCGTLQGDVTISGGGQINMLDLSSITGLLNISGNSPSEFNVVLSSLKTVGNVTAQNVDLLTLPALAQVTSGDFVIKDSAVNPLNLPKLQHINGSLVISQNQGISNVQLPDLESIGGNMTIEDNPSLNTLTSLGDLNSVKGNISMSGPFYT